MNSEPTDSENSDLESVVADLLERVSALEAAAFAGRAGPTSITLGPPPPPGSPPPPPPVGPSPASVAPAAESPEGSVFEWGIEAVLRWSGVGLVTMAAVFLVSTAISRGWIGPELQLLGAALGGAGLHAGAIRLAGTRRSWALALGSGGATVLTVSALATHHLLDLVGPGAAVALVVIATLTSTAVALRTRQPGIALVAGLLALLAPLDTLGGIGDRAVLLWIVGCILAATTLGLVTAWTWVRIVIGWIGALVLLGHAFIERVDGSLRTMGLVGTVLVAITLWTASIVADAASRGRDDSTLIDSTSLDQRLVALVPGWTWAMIASLLIPITDRAAGTLAIGTALVFMALAGATWGRVPRLASTSTVLGALALLATGFAVVLDGPALMVVLAGQAAVSYALGRLLDDPVLGYSGHVAGLASTLLALTAMFEALDGDGFVTFGDGLATLLIVGGWIVGALLLHRQRSQWSDSAYIAAWSGSMLWLAAAIIAAPQGLMLISLAWAASGCCGLVLGLRARSAIVRNVAMATLATTLCKLVGIDMAEIDVFWRVGLFTVVGTGLIALGLKVPTLVGSVPQEPGNDRHVETARTPDS